MLDIHKYERRITFPKKFTDLLDWTNLILQYTVTEHE